MVLLIKKCYPSEPRKLAFAVVLSTLWNIIAPEIRLVPTLLSFPKSEDLDVLSGMAVRLLIEGSKVVGLWLTDLSLVAITCIGFSVLYLEYKGL